MTGRGPRTVLVLFGLGLSGVVAAISSCSGTQRLPKGPPPEYERPSVAPWDAGHPAPAVDLDSIIEQAEAKPEGASKPPEVAPPTGSGAPASSGEPKAPASKDGGS